MRNKPLRGLVGKSIFVEQVDVHDFPVFNHGLYWLAIGYLPLVDVVKFARQVRLVIFIYSFYSIKAVTKEEKKLVRHKECNIVTPLDLVVSLEYSLVGVVPLQICFHVVEPHFKYSLRNRQVQQPECPEHRFTFIKEHVVLILILVSLPTLSVVSLHYLCLHLPRYQSVCAESVPDLLDWQEITFKNGHCCRD